MYRKNILAVILVVFFSCSSEHEDTSYTNPFHEINLDGAVKPTSNFSSFLNESSLIILKDTLDYYHSINKIVSDGSRLFLWEASLGVGIFDMDGNPIYRIPLTDRKGPEDIYEISDIFLEEPYLYILSNSRKEIKRFHIDNFSWGKPLTFSHEKPEAFAISEGLIYTFHTYLEDDVKVSKMSPIIELIDSSYSDNPIFFPTPSTFSRNAQKEMLIRKSFNDTIFKVDSNYSEIAHIVLPPKKLKETPNNSALELLSASYYKGKLSSAFLWNFYELGNDHSYLSYDLAATHYIHFHRLNKSLLFDHEYCLEYDDVFHLNLIIPRCKGKYREFLYFPVSSDELMNTDIKMYERFKIAHNIEQEHFVGIFRLSFKASPKQD